MNAGEPDRRRSVRGAECMTGEMDQIWSEQWQMKRGGEAA